MVPYIFNIILILLTGFVCHFLPIKKEKKNKIFLIVVFLEFFLILAVRKPISDMIKYCEYYSVFGKMSWGELLNFEWEKGYTFINKILYMINPSTRFFIIVTSAFSLIGPYVFIKNYSKNYLMSTLMFVAMNFFGYYYYVIRQVMALSILLVSIRFIKNKKFVNFLICVLIATLFHKSSILFLLGYFIFNFDITLKYLIKVIIGLTILFSIKNIVVNIIGSFIYQEYLGLSTSNGYELLLVMIFILGIIFVYKLFSNIEKNDTIFYNQYIFSIFLQILATSQSVISRLVLDYYIAIIIVLPNMLNAIKKEQKLLINTLAYLGIFILALVGGSNLPTYMINF